MRIHRKYINVMAICTISVFIICAIGIVSLNQKQKNIARFLTVNNQKIQVEIANSSQERSRGLCCRDSLPVNQGMLFMYDQSGDYRFWMKDTRIQLDMFWINSNKQIVHIERDVQPSSYPKVYGTDEPAKYVLETNAGFADKYHIKNRDIVAF